MIKKIDIPIYKAVVYVIYDLDHYSYKKDLKPEIDKWFTKYKKGARKHFKKHIDKKRLKKSGAAARTNWYGNFYTIAFVRPCFTKTPENFNTLVHEAFHAVAEILRVAGVQEANQSTEAYAYMVGWVSQQMLEGYDEFVDKLALENAEEITYETIQENGQSDKGEGSPPTS